MAAGLRIDYSGTKGRGRDTGWMPNIVLIQTREKLSTEEVIIDLMRSDGILGSILTVEWTDVGETEETR